MAYTVSIQQVAAQPIAVVRRRASAAELARVIPDACGEVWNFVRGANVSGAGRHVAVYLDGVMNIEVGVEIGGPLPSDANVVHSSTPAGRVVTTAHFGPYNLLSEAYDAIHQWCRDHQLTLGGPSWEVYGHWTDEPSQLRTDIYCMLADNGA